jgi:CII-binding regulator of phage lambda lysogenization HflD
MENELQLLDLKRQYQSALEINKLIGDREKALKKELNAQGMDNHNLLSELQNKHRNSTQAFELQVENLKLMVSKY